nr:PREDICTED: induced myeloid leukemia cell differentiation protein Mcl-1 [Struthio camelus australis]
MERSARSCSAEACENKSLSPMGLRGRFALPEPGAVDKAAYVSRGERGLLSEPCLFPGLPGPHAGSERQRSMKTKRAALQPTDWRNMHKWVSGCFALRRQVCVAEPFKKYATSSLIVGSDSVKAFGLKVWKLYLLTGDNVYFLTGSGAGISGDIVESGKCLWVVQCHGTQSGTHSSVCLFLKLVSLTGMLRKLEIKKEEDLQSVCEVAAHVFSDGITNWGRVVTLISFGAFVAKHLKSINQEKCISSLAGIITDALVSSKREWLMSQGGWEGFVDFFRVEDLEGSIRNVLMAFAGVAGLGASLAYMIR